MEAYLFMEGSFSELKYMHNCTPWTTEHPYICLMRFWQQNCAKTTQKCIST